MGDQKKTSSSHTDYSTHIDLGEDLIEKTPLPVVEQLDLRQHSGAPAFHHPGARSTDAVPQFADRPIVEEKFSLEKANDYLASARILASEGFSEDAKRILHKILIHEPGHAMARQALTEIQELELKQIFSEAEVRRSLFAEKKRDLLQEINVEALVNQLDADLNLGLTHPFSLFENADLMEDFCLQLEKDLLHAQSSSKDWIDLGIGFLEMGLYFVATRLFEGACRAVAIDFHKETEEHYSAICLQGLSQILAGKPFDAVVRLQPMIRDVEIKREEKIEIFYLMGRAYESMKKFELADYYYQQVFEIQPHYRDTYYRLKVV